MKRFLKIIIIYVLIVASISELANLGYKYTYMNNNPGTMGEERESSGIIKNVPNRIQVCDFGNSHAYYGFNYSDISDVECFNFALSAQTMSYNYRVLRNYKDNIAEDATVIIVLSYSSFFGTPETEDKEFASKNKRYYYFLDADNIKEYDVKTDIYLNYFQGIVARPGEWKNLFFNKELRETWEKETTEEKAIENGPSRFERHVCERCDEDGNRILNQEEIDALYDMIDLCEDIGATPILVTTPYISYYRDAGNELDPEFYGDFYAIIDEVCENTGVKYYDYSSDSRFSHSYEKFINSDHLNRKGAEEFTNILFDEVIYSDK